MSGIVGKNPGRGSGVVGATAIADESVDSDAYVDASIDNAHIADNAVGLAEMAGGTDGNIISYDASGNPVAIATGNDGQVLTSAGAGAPPAFEAAPGDNATVHTWTAGQRGEITGLTDGSTITPDMADSNNFSVTLGGNRTLANPSNLTAGQSGSIFITQDGTGSRTLAYGSYWDFVGGTAPTLTTTAAAIDRIDYVVRTTGSIHAVASLALS
jgi:hypothetical protein